MRPWPPSGCASGSKLLLSGRWTFVDSSTPEPPGRYGGLHAVEGHEDERGERHGAERRGDHARKPVGRLVDDHVSESAAPGNRRDRRRGDDRHRSDANPGEKQGKREREL